MGQEAAQVAAGSGFIGVGPKEAAEVLAGDGLQAGCQTVEQGASLATGDDKGMVCPLDLGWTQQVDLQVCYFEFGELLARFISEHITSMAAAVQIVKSALPEPQSTATKTWGCHSGDSRVQSKYD